MLDLDPDHWPFFDKLDVYLFNKTLKDWFFSAKQTSITWLQAPSGGGV